MANSLGSGWLKKRNGKGKIQGLAPLRKGRMGRMGAHEPRNAWPNPAYGGWVWAVPSGVTLRRPAPCAVSCSGAGWIG